MKLDLFESRATERVGVYDTTEKTLELFRTAPTMLYADIDWIVVVGQFQLNPLRHAPEAVA